MLCMRYLNSTLYLYVFVYIVKYILLFWQGLNNDLLSSKYPCNKWLKHLYRTLHSFYSDMRNELWDIYANAGYVLTNMDVEAIFLLIIDPPIHTLQWVSFLPGFQIGSKECTRQTISIIFWGGNRPLIWTGLTIIHRTLVFSPYIAEMQLKKMNLSSAVSKILWFSTAYMSEMINIIYMWVYLYAYQAYHYQTP